MARTKQSDATWSRLSMVPVYLLTGAELAPGKRVSAGHVEFLPRADAEYCADRRLGLIYATCSVMKR